MSVTLAHAAQVAFEYLNRVGEPPPVPVLCLMLCICEDLAKRAVELAKRRRCYDGPRIINQPQA